MIELLCEIAAGIFLLAMAGVIVAIAVSCTVGVEVDDREKSTTELEQACGVSAGNAASGQRSTESKEVR